MSKAAIGLGSEVRARLENQFLHAGRMNDEEIFENYAADDDMQLLDELLTSSSEEDESPSTRAGSRKGKSRNIERGREAADLRLHQQYFAEMPVYDRRLFRRRFRISIEVFRKVEDRIVAAEPFFKQALDCTGKKGFSTRQKITAALRMMAYGICADALGETLAMSEATALQCLYKFTNAVYRCFKDEYLRAPTSSDMKQLLRRSASIGFPGMIGSINCCKWAWKNCPVAWHGQYEGKEKAPTVTLEAIADSTLWIWHAFFGMPGSCNDINVVEASPLVANIANGTFPPPTEYEICAQRRHIPYWLSEGIYPKWPVFVHSVSFPKTGKEKCLAKMQESRRKDVERAFGVLQARWHIVARPARFWTVPRMKQVMRACVVLHNMMVEDRLSTEDNSEHDEELLSELSLKVGDTARPMRSCFEACNENVSTLPPGSLAALCAARALMENLDEYNKTRRLVMDHLWAQEGDR